MILFSYFHCKLLHTQKLLNKLLKFLFVSNFSTIMAKYLDSRKIVSLIQKIKLDI